MGSAANAFQPITAAIIAPGRTANADTTMALLRAKNPDAAIAQIKVAPTVRDLNQLKKALAASPMVGRWREVETAIEESTQALSAPRLHRSP